MSFTALATKVYRGPIDIVWANSLKDNDDYLYTAASKAWINFDGSATTPTSRASENIASITDSGVGIFTLTFTTGFQSSSLVVFGGCSEQSTTNVTVGVQSGTFNTGSVSIYCDNMNNNEVDPNQVMVVIMGNKK